MPRNNKCAAVQCSDQMLCENCALVWDAGDPYPPSCREHGSSANDVVLDLETMDTSPDAAIVAIGAVELTVAGGTGRTFYATVDLDSSVRSGGTMSAATMLWWLQQSDAARAATFDNSSAYLEDVLHRFAAWIGRREVRVWGDGAAFDNVILRRAYERFGIDPPWGRRDDRCYRTLKELYSDVPFNRVGVHHNAVDDALSQALHLGAILRKMNVVT